MHAAGNKPGLALDGKASGLQLQPLIEALTAHPANFSGTAAFDLNLQGHGPHDHRERANGRRQRFVRHGERRDQGLQPRTHVVHRLELQGGRAGPERQQPNATAYEGIKARRGNGRHRAQRGPVVRTSFMDINGRGTLGLVEQTLDYDLDAKLTGKIAIPGCERSTGWSASRSRSTSAAP